MRDREYKVFRGGALHVEEEAAGALGGTRWGIPGSIPVLKVQNRPEDTHGVHRAVLEDLPVHLEKSSPTGIARKYFLYA